MEVDMMQFENGNAHGKYYIGMESRQWELTILLWQNSHTHLSSLHSSYSYNALWTCFSTTGKVHREETHMSMLRKFSIVSKMNFMK